MFQHVYMLMSIIQEKKIDGAIERAMSLPPKVKGNEWALKRSINCSSILIGGKKQSM